MWMDEGYKGFSGLLVKHGYRNDSIVVQPAGSPVGGVCHLKDNGGH